MMWFVLLAIMMADQATKFVAGREGWVRLNPGVSFGFLASVPAGWLNIGLILLIVCSWLVYRRSWQKMPIAAGFFLGGAVSNIIDRLIWSGVRDWLPIPGTSVQNNVADYGILIGLSLLIWHSLSGHYQALNQRTESPTVESSSTGDEIDKDRS